jgi:hypothetical protein
MLNVCYAPPCASEKGTISIFQDSLLYKHCLTENVEKKLSMPLLKRWAEMQETCGELSPNITILIRSLFESPHHLSPYFALFFYTAPIISWYHITELSFFLHWNSDPMWAPLYTDYLILTIIGFFSELSVPNIPITPLFKNDFGFIKKLQKIELILPLKIRGIGICLEKHSVPFNKLLCLSPPVTLLHFCLANCFLVGSVMKGP